MRVCCSSSSLLSTGDQVPWPTLTLYHRTSASATMSTLVMALDNENYIAAMFLEAACIIDFQHRWMSANTWAKLIKDRYKLNEQLSFAGNALVKVLVLKQNRHLVNSMDIDHSNIP